MNNKQRYFQSSVPARFLVPGLILLLNTAVLVAQQQAVSVQEPEYANQFALMGPDGKLIPLEQEPLRFETQSKRNFVIAPKVTSEEVVPQQKSPVRAAANAHFVVRLHIGDMDPTTVIKLEKFIVRRKDRELLKTQASAGILPFSNVKSQNKETNIPVTVKKYGTNSFEVTPSQPLPPGEYAFVTSTALSCFGVDTSAAASPEAAPAAQPAAPPNQQAAPPGERAPQRSSNPMPANNPAVQSGWRFQAIAEGGHEATIQGIVESGGKRGPAILAVQCSVRHYNGSGQVCLSDPR